METTSQPTGDSDTVAGSSAALPGILAEAQRVEEDSLYSSKGQFEAAQHWNRLHFVLGIPAAVLAAVAGLAAFKDYGTAAGIVAIGVAALAALTTFLNPSAKAVSHHQAGTRLNALRARARVLREVDAKLAKTTEEQLLSTFRAIVSERDKANAESPPIPRWAFERARKGIESGEAQYAADKGKG